MLDQFSTEQNSEDQNPFLCVRYKTQKSALLEAVPSAYAIVT
jgi:hypothetical protein